MPAGRHPGLFAGNNLAQGSGGLRVAGGVLIRPVRENRLVNPDALTKISEP